MRVITCMNKDWIFIKENVGVDEASLSLGINCDLPHTWNAKDGQDGGNDYYRGTCWYVKRFKQPALAEDEEAWLEFRGVAMTAEVYLNGQN